MPLSTYDELRAAIAKTANRTDADFAASVPDFIALAEAEMRREIRARGEVQTLDLTIDDVTYPLPCGFDGMVAFNGTGAVNRGWTFVGIDTMDREFVPGANNYSLSADSLYFSRPPGDVRMRYRALFNALGPRVRCNWVLLKHPDAYLYGALKHAAPWLEDDARIGTWETLFSQAIADINRQAINQQNGGPLVMRSDRVDQSYRPVTTFDANNTGGG
jgi:hypothetical protein